MKPAVSDVSVVIPYHNRDRYIDQTIQSVLAQTVKPLEIIIVNDCSRDTSRKHLDRYADVCVIVDLTTNVGLGAARNEGIRRARGRFIAFLDDDDLWTPEKLKMQREYLERHPECDAVHTAAWAFFLGRQDLLWGRDWPMPLTLAQALTTGFCVLVPTMMIRTNIVRALGGFDPLFRENEDRDFVIRLCAAGHRIDAISEPLARIRREGHESLTNRHWRMFRTDLELCWKHRALYYRVYGILGIANLLLERIQIASSRTRYVDGAVRLLLRFVKVKWRVRESYQEPVLTGGSPRGTDVGGADGMNSSTSLAHE